MLKLGYAETDITPDMPMPLIGFKRADNVSCGVLKPLLAQVSVWESKERCCLICIDSIGFAKIQYFSIGQWCMYGVPYELMVEFALEPMEKLKDKFFFVNGYTNGCLSYFPTEEEYELGGYEVYWSLLIYYKYFNRVYPLEKESASKLIDFIIQENIQL